VEAGDIAYFPRGTYYGPQMRDNGVGLTLQFGIGNEMLGGKDAARVYREGVLKLRELGRIEEGVYIDIDPGTGQERRLDPAEAVAELVTGSKYTIPAERYASPILMHPAAYAYYDVADGVETKQLGAFYDHAGPNGDVRVSMVRLTRAGTYSLTADRAQLAWSISPGLRVRGRVCPELTCIYSPRDEEIVIAGSDNVELFLIEFPVLDL
jgi:hypothetical protein